MISCLQSAVALPVGATVNTLTYRYIPTKHKYKYNKKTLVLPKNHGEKILLLVYINVVFGIPYAFGILYAYGIPHA